MLYGYGLIGLIVLVLDIIAIIKLFQSNAETGAKAIWLLIILFFPFIGMLLYFLLGPKG
jgi:hypothetical protein